MAAIRFQRLRPIITAGLMLLAGFPSIACAGHETRHPDSGLLLHALVRNRANAFGSLTRTVILGRSIQGRPIVAIETGSPASSRKVLVVGCVHGNECAGEAITSRLLRLQPPVNADIWIIPNLNPDGAARGTRGNAHGVDLNRNFPWHWQRLAGVYDSGPRPLSEPEARIAYRLMRCLRPAVSIWFHQHLDLVDNSGGNPSIETRFATLVGLRLARLPREPGSITSWENHSFDGTAFVVELPAGQLRPVSAARFAHATLRVATERGRT